MNKIAKTKIIATIGPASWDFPTLQEMYRNGMQIARINASFADKEEVIRVTKTIHSVSPRIATMLDTEGTTIRVIDLKDRREIKDEVVISSVNSNIPDSIKVTYPDLHKEIKKNSTIFLDDGAIELKVKEIKNESIICTVIQPGILKPNQAVSIPDINLSFPTLTKKDEIDIKIALEQQLDFLAISFVRSKEDIQVVKELTKGSKIKLVAKIENKEGIDNFDEILKEADGIMVARGDLGVETELEKIPVLQKQMIYRCRSAGKPVIVATQMLESMRENNRPTRAEVSDVANSVMDGADAIMLSAETASGKYPVECVREMNKIALAVEEVMKLSPVYGKVSDTEEADEIAKNVCFLSENVSLKAIAVFSNSTTTLPSISRHRPNVPIWSISSDISRVRQDSIFRGVKTYHMQYLSDDRDESIYKAIQTIYTYGELELTDKIAIISGSTIKNKGKDVILEIVCIKDVLFA